MASTVIQILLQARDEASAKMRGLSGSIRKLGGVVKSFIPVLGVIGLGLAFKNIIQSAAEFEQQMSNIATLISGDSTEAIKGFTKGIQELSKVIPKDPKELGAAAYQIVSAGISDVNEALDVLKSSSRLAVAGLGTTEEATDLLTSALNAFGISSDKSEETAAILFNTVKQGKTTVAQLSRAFGMVAPIAAEMGVSLEELQAATAALTLTGLQTSVAQTQLRAAMASLMKPTKEAKDLFDSLGVVSFKQLIDKSGGLVGAFEKLKEAAAGNEEALAKAAGSVEGLNAILSLTGSQSEAFAKTMESTKDATVNFDEAVQKQNETAKAQFQLLKNKLNVELQKLALIILPALVEIMKVLPTIVNAFFIKPFNDATEAVANVIFKVMQAIDAMRRFRSSVSGAISSASSSVSGFVSNVLGGARNVLGLQHGGIVTRPTLAMIGEAGPEAVIPLRGAAGIGGITINMSGTFMTAREAALEFANEIANEIKRQIRV
ncbi:MAG: phage tail tape measure protein [Patescibacteria group bacterium]|nr:phage tail tape measure protein [Patescibacteria group bacterium]